MAVSDGSPQSMRIGDTVLLYAAEAKGYVFSELARWVMYLTSSGVGTVAAVAALAATLFRP